MRYSEIVTIYEKIEATTKRLEMTDLLVALLSSCPHAIIDKMVYLTMGRLYPEYTGIELGVADKLVMHAIADTSGVPETTVEKNCRSAGDLGTVAEKLLVNRRQTTLQSNPLTLEHVYASLERIAHAQGPGAIEQKTRILAGLLSDSSPQEAKYITRTALGQLRLGVADMTLLDALSIAFGGGKQTREDLERAYNLSSDLGNVAKVVAISGIEAIKRYDIVVGRPIRPMLAERMQSASEILERNNGIVAAEYKYDGLRLQAHLTEKGATLFSRRLENMTDQFPDAAKSIRQSVSAREAILEGECVAVDVNTGDMMPFQTISQRRGRKHDVAAMTQEVPVVVYLFDLLYADGKDYTQTPYPDRRRALEACVTENEHISLAKQIVAKSAQQLDEYMEQAVADGCEGLMTKSLSKESIYTAGARGFFWIKYKREYKSEMTDTVDLVAVGAFMGRGRRAGRYGALLFASYNKKQDIFETVCKCGSGFTDMDLDSLLEQLKSSLLSHKHARVNSKLRPDVWLTPSLVMEIIGSEITVSPVHTCQLAEVRPDSGYAIRFPRFTGNYRHDKSPEDATTSEEISAMYRAQLKSIDVTNHPTTSNN